MTYGKKSLPNSARLLRRRLRSQAGAAALEVALVLGLVVIPLIEVVDEISERQADDVEARADRVGNPTGSAGYVAVGNNGTTVTTSSTGPSPSSTDAEFSYSSSQSYNGSNWNVTLEIQVTDPGGNPHSNGDLEGDWYDSSGTKLVAADCSIDVNGLCTVTIKIKKSITNPIEYRVDQLVSNELTISSGAVTEFVIYQS